MEHYHSRYGRPFKKKKSKFHKFIIYTLLIFTLLVLGAAYLLYTVIYKPNVWTGDQESISVYIPSNAGFEDIKKILYTQGVIIHSNSFEWLAKKKKYTENVKPGRYVLNDQMGNNELINMLRLGEQVPVMVIFNNMRNLDYLARKVADQIEADSASIASLLHNPEYLARYDLTQATASVIFIPNTYEFWWTSTADEFIQRMYAEYEKFWDEPRKNKAAALGLTINEVVTLASIVDRETNKDDEKPTIAGVYINRLDNGWKLQADPTLIYAWGDYDIRRVLKSHKDIDSPYNTYKYLGLPPGPIYIPSRSSIDAVLNREKHTYMFFCAKADMSGYHAFAKLITQHNRNARAYQNALNERKIMK